MPSVGPSSEPISSSTETQGRVAIITRTKDRQAFLERNIRTVLAQTYENFVHVIVNDGGDPGPVDELVEKFSQPYRGRCLVVHNKESLKRGGAADAGIRASRSEFIVLLDDDDTWAPRFLAVMVETLQNQELPDSFRGAICHANYVSDHLSENGGLSIQTTQPGPTIGEPTLYAVCQQNYILTCSFLYRRDVLEKTGLYEGRFPICEDWDFNIRFLRYFDVAVVNEYLSNRHFRENVDLQSSVAGTHHVQDFYQAQLRNHYLREDLDNNRVGIGFLLNSGHETLLALDYAKRLHYWENRLRRKIPGVSWLRKVLKKP